MGPLLVLKFPDKRLRKPSQPLKEVTTAIRELAQAMFETMYLENGIGLAAPQVGELIRLIVLDVPKQDPNDPELHESDPLAMVNPEIRSGSGLIQFDEGCLSCPELIVTVDRQAEIRVGYWDLEGRPQEIQLSGLRGVCVQHEIDHLNGVLLVDKVSRMERDLYKKKRIREAKSEKDFVNVL